MSENKEFAKTLNALMDEAHMRPVDLAAASGIRSGMISYYLHGYSTPGSRNLEKLAAALGVRPDALAEPLGGLRAVYSRPEAQGRRSVKAGVPGGGVAAGLPVSPAPAPGGLPDLRADRTDEDTGAAPESVSGNAAPSAGLPTIPERGRVSVLVAARALEVSANHLRAALDQRLVPFGHSVQIGKNSTRRRYYVNAAGLRRFIELGGAW